MAWWTNQSPRCLLLISKFCTKKILLRDWTESKKLINIWSSRALSIYGKLSIIKSLIIPKFVYISSLLPVPKEIVKGLNQMLFKLSTINEYENDGLKMIDLESMIKSLRLGWKWSSSVTKVLGEAFHGFRWNLLGVSFYFIVIMTLKRYIFPLNSIPSYFNGGLSFVVFSIVEGNVNIFCGITKRYVLIISLFSKNKTFGTRYHFRKWSFVWIRHHKFFYCCFE